ncbi:hypothetical protein Gotri_021687 [Gossypium trilobum]|uniref:Uncharacterized protein n=1 Tax=Gossypium trilobum TaxID=34281 RepID=A0A7J9DDR3_9ROSI|nr:hypothetical protein [Gossypium trilobum]
MSSKVKKFICLNWWKSFIIEMVEEELVQLKSDCMMDRIWVHFNTCLLLPLLCSRKESLLSGPKCLLSCAFTYVGDMYTIKDSSGYLGITV